MDPAMTEEKPMIDQQPSMQEAQQVGNANQEDDEGSDPEWDKAETALNKILYEGGVIVDIVRQIMKSDDPANAIANNALDLLRTLDEKTGGQIPEDYLLPLATVLVADIAEGLEAAGRDVPSEELAIAIRTMLIQHLSEFGMDAQQAEEFSNKVDMKQLVSAMDAARAEAQQDEESPEEDAAEPGEEPGEEEPLIPFAKR